ncbi:MAG: four helix bundle protein [Anaerolineae bacterium]|nr:four helix bundle protein [Anaerolineae bacterium]MCO5193203.1 four helix bundle protein [Anaerolineae bacterium]MCO5205454.1 four helix bundle protein [Anaerolineae bacterium]
MSQSNSYRDLIVWQKSITLTKTIYAMTNAFPQSETYGLSNQLRRAAVSVPSNIAEGQVRQSTAEFRRFLSIALGSLAEVDTQLVIAYELGYISIHQLNTTESSVTEIRKMLYSLMKHLSRSN